MRINTNLIGNYNILKTGTVKPKIESQKTDANLVNDQISSDEKNFFANLYPDKKKEINDYHFYSRSGSVSGISLGSLIDRRG